MLTQLNPKTWIVAGLVTLPLALLPLELIWRFVLLMALLAPLVLAGYWSIYLRYVLWGVGPVALTAFVIQTVSYPHAQTIYASWTPVSFLQFQVSFEGIMYGATLAVQILNFATACALISLPNTPGALRWALTDWKLPPRLVYLLVTSLNAPALLRRYAAIIRESQIRRGLDDSTLVKRFVLGIKSIGTLVNLILLEHEDRAVSLGQRGLDHKGQRSSYTTCPDSSLQSKLRILIGLVAAGVFILGVLS